LASSACLPSRRQARIDLGKRKSPINKPGFAKDRTQETFAKCCGSWIHPRLPDGGQELSQDILVAQGGQSRFHRETLNGEP